MKRFRTEQESKEIFSRNVKRYLELSGKTQKEAAAAIGVSTGNFCDWMKLRTYPRIEKIQALAAFFGVTLSDLVEENTPTDSDEQDNKEDEEILYWFHKVPKEKRELVLSMIRIAVDTQK